MNEEKPVLSKKKKAVFILILAICFGIFLIFLGEAYAILMIRKLGWNYEPVYIRLLKGYTSANLIGGRVEYKSWGSWNVPGYEGRIANNCFDVTYSFNSYGARDRQRDKTGSQRTLIFGDSFMEGWGVPQEKILTAQLEEITGKEFLNFGVAGSGTGVLNEYVLYRDFARDFEHDAVAVGLYPGNDFKDNDPDAWGESKSVYYRPFWKLNEEKDDIEIVYFAEQVEGKYLPGLEPENRDPHFRISDSWKEWSAMWIVGSVLRTHEISLTEKSATEFAYDLAVSDDARIATEIVYRKFAELIGEEKNKFIFIIPAASDVFYYLKSGKQKPEKFNEFTQTLQSYGWRVIDLIDVFAEVPEGTLAEYFICDGHWNANGNRLVAEYLADIF